MRGDDKLRKVALEANRLLKSEKEKTVKILEQQSKRRPPGSVFVGQTRQKEKPSGSSVMLLAHYRCSCSEKRVVTLVASIYAKHGKRNTRKLPKNVQNSPKLIETAPTLAKRIDFRPLRPSGSFHKAIMWANVASISQYKT